MGPDPDGVGPGTHAATRVTFNTRGLVTLVEEGFTPSQTDSGWNNFAQTAAKGFTYDSVGRPLTEGVATSNVTNSLVQHSYDARGRLECSATRMNTAQFSSLPASACNRGTTGTFGPDRVVRYTYDAADQVTMVQSGYNASTGTAVATERSEYSGNGLVSAVVDANNNRTGYEYDAHDRPKIVRFPHPTSGSNQTSPYGDYMEFSRADNVNVTQVRLRDGQLIGYQYDNLGRVTTKDVPNTVYGESDVSYSYNLLGQLLTANSPYPVVNTWDALGRLKTTSTNGYLKYLAYDAAGNLRQLSWHDLFYVDYEIGRASCRERV